MSSANNIDDNTSLKKKHERGEGPDLADNPSKIKGQVRKFPAVKPKASASKPSDKQNTEQVAWSESRVHFLREEMKKEFGTTYATSDKDKFFNLLNSYWQTSLPCQICEGHFHSEKDCKGVDQINTFMGMFDNRYTFYPGYVKNQAWTESTKFYSGHIDAYVSDEDGEEIDGSASASEV